MRCRQIRWQVSTRVPAPADWLAPDVVQVFLGVRIELDTTRAIFVLDDEDRGYVLEGVIQGNALRLFDELEQNLTVKRLRFYGFEQIPEVRDAATGVAAEERVDGGDSPEGQ